MSFTPKKCPPGCVYAMRSGPLRHCGYILITGHMRDCDPGYGCTRYTREDREKTGILLRVRTRACKNCGKQFEPPQVQSKYCCSECAAEGTRRSHRAYESKARAERALQRIAICKICGKPFFGYSSRSVLCSPECRKAVDRARQQAYRARQAEKQETEEKT